MLITPVSAQTQPSSEPGTTAAPAANPPTSAPAPTPAAPAADSSTPVPAASEEPIGNVAKLTGIATVIRNKNSLALHLRDDIFLNDIVQTSSSSSLGITFNDATTFNLSANAKITIDSYLYEESGKQNTGVFDIGKGTVAFVAAAVAKTGDMKITTPTSTLGIRGTTGLAEVPEGGGAAGAANNVNIKLYPDQDGHVGRIEVNDRAGQRLGALTQGASGFTIRPGIGGARPVAERLTISPQQATRDQGFVREVHAMQATGRQIVTEQRAARRANPPGANPPNRGNQPAQPQRQNQAPGQNRPGQPQQPATPNRQGQQQQPRGTQPATTKPPAEKPGTKPGTPTPQRQGVSPTPPAGAPSPASPQPPLRQGATPASPGAQRQATPKAAQQKPRQAAPKREEKKKR